MWDAIGAVATLISVVLFVYLEWDRLVIRASHSSPSSRADEGSRLVISSSSRSRATITSAVLWAIVGGTILAVPPLAYQGYLAIADGAYEISLRLHLSNFYAGAVAGALARLIVLPVSVQVMQLINKSRISTEQRLQHIEGSENIYRSSAELIEEATREILAIVASEQPRAPEWWLKHLAKRLKYAKEHSIPLQAKFVLLGDFDPKSQIFKQQNDDRLNIFTEHGVKELFTLYLLTAKSTVTFDVLIIDSQHVYVAFRPLKPMSSLQHAIFLKNQREVASELRRWAQNYILDEAKVYSSSKKD